MQHLELSYSPSDSHKSSKLRLLTTDSGRRRLLGRRLSATECWAPGLRTGAARGTAHHPLHYQCPGACALCPGYVQHYLVSRWCCLTYENIQHHCCQWPGAYALYPGYLTLLTNTCTTSAQVLVPCTQDIKQCPILFDYQCPGGSTGL